MSYTSPVINSGAAVKQGIDVPIEAIRVAISELTWMSKSFGRAMTFREINNATGKLARTPKVYEQSGEYINVLPNDSIFSSGVAASSFIRVVGPERYESYEPNSGSLKTARLSVIIWGDLKKIDPSKDYIFTEYLKSQIEAKIKDVHFVSEIIEWYDENVEDVFNGYDFDEEITRTEFLMYPYAGIRVDVNVTYPEAC